MSIQDRINAKNEEFSEAESSKKGKGFSELIRYTLSGYFLGLMSELSNLYSTLIILVWAFRERKNSGYINYIGVSLIIS